MSEDKKTPKEKKERQKIGKVLQNNFRMAAIAAKYCPSFPLLVILDGILGASSEVLFTVFSVRVLNMLDSGNPSFRKILWELAAYAVIYLVIHLFFSWYNSIYKPIIEQKIQYGLQGDLYKKALSMDLACYDDPAFYNDFVFAMDQAKDKGQEVVFGLGNLLRKIIGGGALITLMMSVSPAVGILLLASGIGILVFDHLYDKVSFKQEQEGRPFHRKNSYINRIHHLSDYSKELRISRVSGTLEEEYDEAVDSIVDLNIRYAKKYLILDLLSVFFNYLGTFGALLLSFYLLLKGEILVGGFAASVSVVWNLEWQIYDFFREINNLPKRSLYIDKYFTFLAYENKVLPGTAIPDDFESLEFRKVSFGYPFDKEQNFSLKEVSFTVKKGEKIAIVGYNGAGKTTLTKLMMRLYDPTEGQILYNGVDIREYDTAAYRKKICALFQDFKIFAATLGENVMNGEYTDADGDRVRASLDAASFTDRLSELEKGIQTQMTKEFFDDGVNLSGGESQKVAIARIFAGNHDLLIMDEPSSALDPAAA
ncbi:MAG: ABC transporter ATP-binding protein, partial [Eubacteriales bacterium]